MRTNMLSAAVALAIATLSFSAQAHETDPSKLGVVNFPTSCNPKAQPAFNRGAALIYNYFWAPALKAFEEVVTHDPACAMAFWGAAVINMDNTLAAPPTPKQMTEGTAAIEKATALGGKTQRERDLIAAVAEFYRDHAKVPHMTRLENYEKAMGRAHQRYPNDQEIAVLYALALQATASPADQTFSKQLQSAKILEKVALAQPDHPGAQHFLVHAYDYPPIAKQGLASARRYAKLAPDSPHALHMPSHIFTRLGLWEESIESNLRSAKSCDTPRCALHALDYAAYAYLQLGRDAEAKKVMDQILALAAAEPLFVAAYAQAAVPARYALERGNWAEAAAQSTPPRAETAWAKLPQAESVLVFARGLGAARSGDTAKARQEIARLGVLRETLTTMQQSYWAEQAEIQSKIVAGWTARAEGRNDEAVKLLREAADKEDATSKHIVTPGPIAPARELLAELLMDLKQPKDALREFTKAMEREPGRLRTLHGAGLAAERSGNEELAKTHYKQLVLMTQGTERPDIVKTKEFLARN